MGKEIERKFLLKTRDWQKNADAGRFITQGYLSTEVDRTVRVRIYGEDGFLTVKGKTRGMTRTEFEYPIPLDDAKELLDLCSSVIEKKRYLVVDRDLTWEIDIFGQENHGLELAEVEVEHESQPIRLPKWIGEEVTEDNRYYNSSLIDNPFQRW